MTQAHDGGPLLTTAKPCEVHGKHVPNPHVNHLHHVWPKGHGGPDVAENRIVACPTGHYNIHQLLADYLAHQGELPYSVTKQYSTKEREYAKLGYDRITRQAL